MERIDPINFDTSWPECAGCGTDTDHEEVLDGVRYPVCVDCLHDSTTQCAVCPTRIWIADGWRMDDGTINCRDCAALAPSHVQGRMRELRRDVARDDFDQVRR